MKYNFKSQAISTVIADLPKNDAWWVGTDSEKYVVPVQAVFQALERNALLVGPEPVDFGAIDGEMVKVSGKNDVQSGNTYNSGDNLSHNLCYYSVDTGDGYYIGFAIHRAGDVRCNYTDFVIFKFDSFEACWETIEEVAEDFMVDLDVDGEVYCIRPEVVGEGYYIWGSNDEWEAYPNDITDEAFTDEIRQHFDACEQIADEILG